MEKLPKVKKLKVPKKKSGAKTESAAESPPKEVIISPEFDTLAEGVKGDLNFIRHNVGDLSLKEAKRTIVALLEHPVEDSVEIPTTGICAQIIQVGRALQYSKLLMNIEMMKINSQSKKEENNDAENSN